MDTVKNKLNIYIIPILSILGIMICLELCWVYYNANFIANSLPSFCHISNEIDCDAVAKSAYASFFGIPLSLYGLGFYTFILLLSTLLSKKLENYKSYIFVASMFSIAISLILMSISSIVIHKICILCYMTYFVNLLIFLISWRGKTLNQRFKDTYNGITTFLSNRTYRISFLCLILAGLIADIIITQYHVFTPTQKNNITIESTAKASNDTNYGNILGDRNSKVIIREYTDFQCPYCAMSDQMLHQLVKETKGVEVIHYDFPMGRQCNRIITQSEHQYSCTAALYSIASKKQNKMVQFNSLLFENQQNLAESKILELAKSIKLDTTKLKQDAYSTETKKELQESIESGIELGITGTPTYVIGVKKYDGYIPYPQMKAIVQSNMR